MNNDVYAELLAAEAALAMRSPLDLGKYVNRRDKFEPGSSAFEEYAYSRMLSDTIVRFVNHPTAKYLLLSGPVRHGKSWMLSRTVPTWYLANFPDKHVILAGYGANFASTWGRFTRDQVANHPELGIGIDQSARSVEHFALARPHVGSMTATGVGGSITGRGAHLFLIDDPLKNPEEALSDTYRAKQEEWYWSTADTRLEPGGKMILTMARWHNDDLFGSLSERLDPAVTWRVETPAVADGNPFDPTGRAEGEPLVPERYSAEALGAIQGMTDPWAWAALYQCSPQLESGGMFSKEGRRSYTTTPTHYVLQQPGTPPVFIDKTRVRRFVTADLAATKKSSSDWTVFSVWDACLLPDTRTAILLLAGVVRTRIDAADHFAQAMDVRQRFNPVFIGVEKATFGLALITQLQRARVPVRELLADTDKVSRAIPASSAWNAGRVFLPDASEMPEVEDLAQECHAFHNGKHDDFVDTLAYAVKELDLGPVGPSLGALRPRPPEPEPGTGLWLRKKMERGARNRKRSIVIGQ